VDSPPKILSTTPGLRASPPGQRSDPEKYLKSSMARLYISFLSTVHRWANHQLWRLPMPSDRNLRATAFLHPAIDLPGVKHHFAHVESKPEK